jgi:hypothetical protein
MYHVDINKKQISDIFCISDVTISKTYRKIFPYHKIIMNNKVTDLILEKKNSLQKETFIVSEDNLISSEKSANYESEESYASESECEDLVI